MILRWTILSLSVPFWHFYMKYIVCVYICCLFVWTTDDEVCNDPFRMPHWLWPTNQPLAARVYQLELPLCEFTSVQIRKCLRCCPHLLLHTPVPYARKHANTLRGLHNGSPEGHDCNIGRVTQETRCKTQQISFPRSGE